MTGFRALIMTGAAVLIAGAGSAVSTPASAQGWGVGLRHLPGLRVQQVQFGPMSEGELRMRMALMQHSMGFGGIFAPFIKSMTGPSGSSSACANYSDYAACQAAKNGDYWAADRLQNNQSSGEERDWYDR